MCFSPATASYLPGQHQLKMCSLTSLPTLEQTAVRIQKILSEFRGKYPSDDPKVLRLEVTLADFYAGLERRAALVLGS